MGEGNPWQDKVTDRLTAELSFPPNGTSIDVTSPPSPLSFLHRFHAIPPPMCNPIPLRSMHRDREELILVIPFFFFFLEFISEEGRSWRRFFFFCTLKNCKSLDAQNLIVLCLSVFWYLFARNENEVSRDYYLIRKCVRKVDGRKVMKGSIGVSFFDNGKIRYFSRVNPNLAIMIVTNYRDKFLSNRMKNIFFASNALFQTKRDKHFFLIYLSIKSCLVFTRLTFFPFFFPIE